MLTTPRGTRDFTSEEMHKRNLLLDAMKQTFLAYGYAEIQTPTFEHLELFTKKSGASIVEELYTFTDKGGRDLALRPELTAPVIRLYNEQLQVQPKPLKLFYFGNCFRYDRPQKGRYREFWQIGCELLGSDSPEAIAELIALAFHVLSDVGLKDIVLRIGQVKLLSIQVQLVKDSLKEEEKDSFDIALVLRLIDKEDFEEVEKYFYDKGCPEHVVTRFFSFLECKTSDAVAGFFHEGQQLTIVKQYQKVLGFLPDLKVDAVEVDMRIARGLDYYTGIVFEIDAPVLGAEKQLCGGGQYELIGQLGGNELASSGFAIGFDRTLLALESEQFKFTPPRLDVFIIPVTKDQLPPALRLCQELRNQKKSVDIDLLRRGIGKGLKYANSKNATFAVIIGEKEVEQNKVTLRNMSSGEQVTISSSEIINYM